MCHVCTTGESQCRCRLVSWTRTHTTYVYTFAQLVFSFFKYSEETVLPPDQIRRSLSVLYSKVVPRVWTWSASCPLISTPLSILQQCRFQIGEMDDATEAMEAMFKQMHLEQVCSTAILYQDCAKHDILFLPIVCVLPLADAHHDGRGGGGGGRGC